MSERATSPSKSVPVAALNSPSTGPILLARPASPTYHNIQLLRGIAALMVVAHHVFVLLIDRGIYAEIYWVSGAAGVDIFFPISGFLMMVTTRNDPARPDKNRHFLLKRFLRIAPLYWLLTTVKVLLLLAVPALAVQGHLESWHTLTSYLFLPGRNFIAGHNHPVLPIGWTLNLEMFFYALFALVLFAGGRPLRWIAPALVALVALRWVRPEMGATAAFYSDPIVIEFVFGMLVAAWIMRGRRLSRGVALVLAPLSFAVLLSTEYLPGFSGEYRLLFWGVPGAILLFALLSLEGELTRLPFYRFGLLVGDASYAIYLVHGFVLTAVGLACSRLGYSGMPATVGVMLVSVTGSIVAGIGLHRFVEAPVGRFLSTHLVRRRSRRVPFGATGSTSSGKT